MLAPLFRLGQLIVGIRQILWLARSFIMQMERSLTGRRGYDTAQFEECDQIVVFNILLEFGMVRRNDLHEVFLPWTELKRWHEQMIIPVPFRSQIAVHCEAGLGLQPEVLGQTDENDQRQRTPQQARTWAYFCGNSVGASTKSVPQHSGSTDCAHQNGPRDPDQPLHLVNTYAGNF